METTAACPLSSSGETCMQVLRELFEAIWIARGAGEDVSELLFTVDMLLPPALLQEALRCIDEEGIAGYYCAASAAHFHVVKCSARHLAAAPEDPSSSNSARRSADVHPVAAAAAPPFFLVTSDFCSCEGTEHGAAGLEDGGGVTCAHRIAVELAEVLDGVKQRHVLRRRQFSHLLLTYSHQVLQQQYGSYSDWCR